MSRSGFVMAPSKALPEALTHSATKQLARGDDAMTRLEKNERITKTERLRIEVSGPYQCYCLASRRSARYLTRLYESHFEPTGLTSSQFSILSLLQHEPGLTVFELSNAMEMERTTMVRTLRPLKDAGFVEEGAEKQGRAVILFLTAPGMAKIEEAEPFWKAAQRAFEEHVGRDEASRLRDMMLTVIPQQES